MFLFTVSFLGSFCCLFGQSRYFIPPCLIWYLAFHQIIMHKYISHKLWPLEQFVLSRWKASYLNVGFSFFLSFIPKIPIQPWSVPKRPWLPCTWSTCDIHSKIFSLTTETICLFKANLDHFKCTLFRLTEFWPENSYCTCALQNFKWNSSVSLKDRTLIGLILMMSAFQAQIPWV